MNTQRIDSVLQRQKRSALVDVVFTTIVALGILVYVIALGNPKPVTSVNPPDVHQASAVEVDPGCPTMPDDTGDVAVRC